MADRISLSANATVQASWGAATATPTNAPPTDTPSASEARPPQRLLAEGRRQRRLLAEARPPQRLPPEGRPQQRLLAGDCPPQRLPLEGRPRPRLLSLRHLAMRHRHQHQLTNHRAGRNHRPRLIRNQRLKAPAERFRQPALGHTSHRRHWFEPGGSGGNDVSGGSEELAVAAATGAGEDTLGSGAQARQGAQIASTRYAQASCRTRATPAAQRRCVRHCGMLIMSGVWLRKRADDVC